MSGSDPATRAERAERVGLCSHCVHAASQTNARGSEFWRCRAAEGEPALLRYPPLPVRDCRFHEDGEPDSGGADR